MNKLMHYITDLIFPPRCAVCGEVTLIGTEICGSCFDELKTQFNGIELCSRCGKPLNSCICPNIPCLAGCASVFEYCDKTQKLLQKLKTDVSSTAAVQLADMMAERFNSCDIGSIHFDCITYVPTNSTAISVKGFDHAQRLAEYLGIRLHLPVIAPPIEQISVYISQHSLNKTERIDNVNRGYTSSESKTANGNILLVDDIITTGATLNRCAELLLLCGADSVYCITAATTFLRHE